MKRLDHANPSRFTRWVAPVLASAALLATGAVATADPGGGPAAKGGPAGVCAKLKCSEDQKTQLRQRYKKLREDSKADREAIKALHGEMAREWTKDAPNESALTKLQAKIHKHRVALATIVHDAMMDVHAVLSPAQRTEFAKLIAKRGFRPGGGRGKGKGDRGD